jgi:AbrB family looped-hinge helix DNA binding protein
MFSPESGDIMKKEDESCCDANGKRMGLFKVESVVSVDERGQMVLPKEIRDKANIKAGDKLAVVSFEKDGKVCCISLILADGLTEMVKDLLGPMMKEVL